MSLLVGLLIGVGVGMLVSHVRLRSREQRDNPLSLGMRAGLLAANATLPHLRRGLTRESAERAVPHLRALTGAAAIALADSRQVLAIDGEGREQVRPGDLLSALLAHSRDDRPQVIPGLVSSDPSCPLRSAALAAVRISDDRVGTLIAFYRNTGGPRAEELLVLEQAALLVAAQVELSALAEGEERVAQAELRALRAQISPHFIYNALAAVAGHIHTAPEEARELLIDFSEFTRYLFRDARPLVTLGEELQHVERYLRLEHARFGRALRVHFAIPEEALKTSVPTLSVQPLVENAVRHVVEQREEGGTITISAHLIDSDVQLRVCDDGPGIAPDRVPGVLAGTGGGIGLSNVNGRLRATFGDPYQLRLEADGSPGTTVVMTVPAGATVSSEPPTRARPLQLSPS